MRALYERSGTLFVGGSFSAIGGEPRAGLASLDANGHATNWDPGFTRANVYTIVPGANGTLLAGGAMSNFNLFYSTFGVAAFDANGALLPPRHGVVWGDSEGGEGTVFALVIAGTAAYALGDFDTVGGAPSSFLTTARPNLTSFDQMW